MRTFFLDFVLKLLSAQVTRTSHGSLTTEENLPSPRPAASVPTSSRGHTGKLLSGECYCSRQTRPGLPATSRECRVAARDEATVPMRPSKPPSFPCRPEATRLRGHGQWHLTPARPGTPVTRASAQGLQQLHEHSHGCGGLSLTNYFCKCSMCCSRGKREAIGQTADC